MELMDFSLYALYKNFHSGSSLSNPIFPEEILGIIAARITEALAFCKSKDIMHRDVKPDNILLNKNGQIKLCDFGESKKLINSLAISYVGTIVYWPPERFSSKSPFDVRSDIWSLGITLLEVAYGGVPYFDKNSMPSTNIMIIQTHIVKADAAELIEKSFGSKYSRHAKTFAANCLHKLSLRPKYDELQNLLFCKKYISYSDASVADFINHLNQNQDNLNGNLVSMKSA